MTNCKIFAAVASVECILGKGKERNEAWFHTKMEETSEMKIVTIVSGIVLTLAGIWSIALPGVSYASMAFLLGVAMLIHGICEILNCVTEHRSSNASGYIFAEGIFTIILSFIVLGDQLIADVMVPMFFGMWLLMSGLMHIMQALAVRKKGEKNWKLALGFGILNGIFGCSGLLHSVAAALPLVRLLGCYFLMQGISVIVMGLHVKNIHISMGKRHTKK